MKVRLFLFIPDPSALIFFSGRRSQVVRQSSAKALFIGSIPIAASKRSPISFYTTEKLISSSRHCGYPHTCSVCTTGAFRTHRDFNSSCLAFLL